MSNAPEISWLGSISLTVKNPNVNEEIDNQKPDDVDEEVSSQDRPPVQIVNKFNRAEGYSGNLFDIKSATKGGIVYPSMDPSCFELKYPNIDIEVRVVGDSTGGES